jgi:hypothetical protein
MCASSHTSALPVARDAPSLREREFPADSALWITVTSWLAQATGKSLPSSMIKVSWSYRSDVLRRPATVASSVSGGSFRVVMMNEILWSGMIYQNRISANLLLRPPVAIEFQIAAQRLPPDGGTEKVAGRIPSKNRLMRWTPPSLPATARYLGDPMLLRDSRK